MGWCAPSYSWCAPQARENFRATLLRRPSRREVERAGGSWDPMRGCAMEAGSSSAATLPPAR